MIKLEINSQKELTVTKKTKVFKGENLINSFEITAVNPSVGNKRVEDCDFFLHVVLPDDSFIAYPVEWSPNSIPLTGFVPITYDITADAQILRLYIEIKSENTVIGKSNTVELQVFDSPNEVTGITPREQLEEELASAATLTETLEALKGTYDSVPERLAADEAQLSSNTADLGSFQSLLLSHAVALGNKLDDADSEIQTNHIAQYAVTQSKIANGAVTDIKISNSAVTAEKIRDGSVTDAKLSQALRDKLDSIPEAIVMFVKSIGSLSSSIALDSGDFCTLGGFVQFTAVPPLSSAIGVSAGTLCELRYVNGYQVVTVTSTQQVFVRKVNSVAPTFSAGSWVQITTS